ncbi:MAG: LysR substrate-binding domain-containing protein [Pseudomonadota bacterium]
MSEGDMRVFASVLSAGSFAAAAKALAMTPSGVSRRIGRLEERLGVRLLNRTTRRLSLTDAGERYHLRALQIIADIDEAEREAADLQGAPRGRLRITAGNAYGSHRLMPLIPDFLAKYPEVEIELTLLDRMVDLVGEGFDIAFRSGDAPDSTLMARNLPDVEFVTCASPEYLTRHGEPQVPEDLLAHTCLVHLIGERRMNRWFFTGPKGQEVVTVSGPFVANNLDMLYRACLKGLGVLHAVRIVAAPALADGRLVQVLERYDKHDVRPMRMLYPSARQLSPKVRAFIDFATDYWRESAR